MAEVSSNSNINMAEFTAKCMEVEGYHSAGPELDAQLRTDGEDVVWKTFDNFEHDELIGHRERNQNMNNRGFGGFGALNLGARNVDGFGGFGAANLGARNVDGFGGFGAPAAGANAMRLRGPNQNDWMQFTRPVQELTEAANFAVLEHNRQSYTVRVFVRLHRSAKWRSSVDTYYLLIIATRDTDTLASHLSKALVKKNKYGKTLLGWVEIK